MAVLKTETKFLQHQKWAGGRCLRYGNRYSMLHHYRPALPAVRVCFVVLWSPSSHFAIGPVPLTVVCRKTKLPQVVSILYLIRSNNNYHGRKTACLSIQVSSSMWRGEMQLLPNHTGFPNQAPALHNPATCHPGPGLPYHAKSTTSHTYMNTVGIKIK